MKFSIIIYKILLLQKQFESHLNRIYKHKFSLNIYFDCIRHTIKRIYFTFPKSELVRNKNRSYSKLLAAFFFFFHPNILRTETEDICTSYGINTPGKLLPYSSWILCISIFLYLSKAKSQNLKTRCQWYLPKEDLLSSVSFEHDVRLLKVLHHFGHM